MSDKKRAEEVLKKMAIKKATPYAKKIAERGISSLGGNPETVAKALALAKVLRDGKIKGKYKTKDGKRIEGEIDAKNKSIKAGISWDF